VAGNIYLALFMGLGKTVVVIALALARPCPPHLTPPHLASPLMAPGVKPEPGLPQPKDCPAARQEGH